MDVTPLIKEGQQIIQSYAGGGFKISGVPYNGPVIVQPHGTVNWEDVSGEEGVKALKTEDFQSLIDQAERVDVVLLGTGKMIAFLPPDLKNTLKNKGLAVEVMDTGAACRTYNVLMAEGRRVVAALLPAA